MNFFKTIESGEVEKIILGRNIEKLESVSVGYNVTGILEIDNVKFTFYHRESSVKERIEGKEKIEDGEFTLEEYFDQFLKGKKVVDVSICEEGKNYLWCSVEGGGMFELELPLRIDLCNTKTPKINI